MFLSEAKKILKKNGYRIDERLNKDYFRFNGYECILVEDSYEEGLLDESSIWNKSDKQTFTTVKELIDYIKNSFADEFFAKKEIKNNELYVSNYNDGSFTIGFSILVNNNEHYLSVPTASEKAAWKKGKKKLYNLDIVGFIESNFEADELYVEFKKLGITDLDL